MLGQGGNASESGGRRFLLPFAFWMIAALQEQGYMTNAMWTTLFSFLKHLRAQYEQLW